MKILELPQDLDAHVAYHDPHVPAVPGLRGVLQNSRPPNLVRL